MTARLNCIFTLEKIIKDKVFFNTLKDTFKPEDRAFANFLILTALRRKVVVERLLDTMLLKKIPNKNKILQYVLLLGAVELLYAKTPAYAVINEYVAIAKKITDVFSSRMVNAVLRKVALEKENMQNACAFPDNFNAILKQDYSPEEIKKMEKMLCLEAPVDLTLKQDPEVWVQRLNGVLFENGTLRLITPQGGIDALSGYQSGAWWVQDLAASLPVCLMQNIKGKKVLDLCAAPGGKTAQLLSKGAVVTAVDISPERLEILKENIQRLNFHQTPTVICDDGLEYLKKTKEIFDIILLDAPCSATGTFRKHPEVLYFKTTDDVMKQIPLQKALLVEAAKHVQNEGSIFYATCSLSKAEGEMQIKHFLQEHGNFELVDFSKQKINKYEAEKLDENMFDKQVLRTLPYHNKDKGGADGFFAAALKRIK